MPTLTQADQDRITIARAALRRLRDEVEPMERKYDWTRCARPNQLAPPGDWRVWLVMAGRGFGKTRVGAEYIRQRQAAGVMRMAVVGPTADDVRAVMVEGESGLLSVYPSGKKPHYEPSKRRLTWSNGAIATLYSAEEPERLRGPQHEDAWVDEVGAWKYLETWDMLMLGLRIGSNPRCVVTTTPRPIKLLRDLKSSPTTAITVGSTYENRANLAPAFFDQIIKKYEGTRLGRQELEAELLDDAPDALWKRAVIDALRVKEAPALKRVIVAVDPAVTDTDESDMTGIVVAGLGEDGHGYILADLSLRGSPDAWARTAVGAYRDWQADGVVAEVNNGGDLVEATLRAVSANIPYRAVRASRGKAARCEPVSALYEQGKVHHVGSFDRLEDQMCSMTTAGYTGAGSPDNTDAAVWALSELMLVEGAIPIQAFPDFRAFGPRGNEPPEANHVIEGAPLDYWWKRWVSIAWGAQPAVHWWCQHPDSRVHLYREFVGDNIGPEALGSIIAEQSRDDMKRLQQVSAYLAPEWFDAGTGKKCVAQQISDGIANVMGKTASFLLPFTETEHRMDMMSAWRERGKRARAMKIAAITVSEGSGDVNGGWEYLRSLLRWMPLQKTEPLEYNRGFARELYEEPDGKAKYYEYMRLVEGRPGEILPGLLIHSRCDSIIRSLSSAVRDEKGVRGNGDLQSALLGVLAHMGTQSEEPLEAVTARRIEHATSMHGEDQHVFAMIGKQADQEWKKKHATMGYRFARLPKRRM